MKKTLLILAICILSLPAFAGEDGMSGYGDRKARGYSKAAEEPKKEPPKPTYRNWRYKTIVERYSGKLTNVNMGKKGPQGRVIVKTKDKTLGLHFDTLNPADKEYVIRISRKMKPGRNDFNEPSRIWSKMGNKNVRAKYTGYRKAYGKVNIYLVGEAGKKLTFDINDLSEPDQDYLKEIVTQHKARQAEQAQQRSTNTVETINWPMPPVLPETNIVELTTMDGTTYKNARPKRVERSSVLMYHSRGVATVPLSQFPEDALTALGLNEYVNKLKELR